MQYFERRRLGYHPENAGTPYDILLGLLGRDIYPGCVALRDGQLQLALNRYQPRMGCPNPAVRDVLSGAAQQYEHGWMIWIDATASAPPMIFALYQTPSGMNYRWLAFTDAYREGEQSAASSPQPAGSRRRAALASCGGPIAICATPWAGRSRPSARALPRRRSTMTARGLRT